jgi:hypothetical protein
VQQESFRSRGESYKEAVAEFAHLAPEHRIRAALEAREPLEHGAGAPMQDNVMA